MMEGMNWLATGLGYMVALAGMITAISVAGSWIWKGIKNLRKPHFELSGHLDNVEESFQKHESMAKQKFQHYDRCLKDDQTNIKELKTDIQVLFGNVLKLAHSSTDSEELYKLRKEIEDHLLSKSLNYDRR